MPKSTTISQDGKKVETTLALAPGMVLLWSNQNNALKTVKTAHVMEPFSSLNFKPQLIRKTCLTPLQPSVKL